MKHIKLLATAVLLFLLINNCRAASVGTAITYQGRLTDNGSPASDAYDMRFTLHSTSTGTNDQVGGTIQITSVIVTNGLFKEELDFGATPFTGEARWLEIAVRRGGTTNPFTVLDQRQRLSPAPYALFAPTAAIAARATSVAPNVISALQFNTVTTPTNGQVLSYNGASLVWTNASNIAAAWNLGGNRGTAAGTNFIGTLDLQPLELWVNGQRALRLEPVPSFQSSVSGAVNVIGGSSSNYVSPGAYGATIGGGGGTREFPGLQHPNRVYGNFGTVGGGRDNTSWELASTVSGGMGNTSTGVAATVSGGIDNIGSGPYSTVSGGETNRSISGFATVGGGSANISGGPYSTIGGGQENAAPGQWATVGGGWRNKSLDQWATVGGGASNNSDAYGTVGGGAGNTSGGAATVGGGNGNTAGGPWATVAGGLSNTSSGEYAAVGGGESNTSSGARAIVGGGFGNISSNEFATVPGGCLNIAGGPFSFAAGLHARALHKGAFVWADSFGFNSGFDSGPDFSSTATNQFAARATGGVRFVSAADATGGPTAGVSLEPGGTSWGVISDRNAKKDFVAIDARNILEKLAGITIESWRYRWEDTASSPHIGPVAQDFKAAFYPGRDDKTITTLEIDGVALAAIQGLNTKLEEMLKVKDAEIRSLRRELASLQQSVSELANKKGDAR